MSIEKPAVGSHQKAWSIFFVLLTTQSTLGFVISAALPSDGQGVVFGLSPLRLALLAALAGLAAGAAFLAGRSSGRGLPGWLERDGWLNALLIGGFATALLAPLLLTTLTALSRQGEVFRYSAYAARLAPILWVAALTGAELVFLTSWLRKNRLTALIELLHSFSTPWLVATAAGAALLTFILITRVGLTPQTVGSWGGPAVPFLEWQIALVWVGTLAVLLLGLRRQKPLPAHFDTALTALIWVSGAVLWLSQPVNPAYFATPPRAPNFELYPFSDALTYAQNAQSILAGVTWQGDIPARPLYVTLLAGLHVLAGQNYTAVIAAQTLLLALFPALLYLIGKEMGSRPLGLAAAALTLLRDITANQSAPFTLNLTYSKLFFSELPTALLLSLAVYSVLRWLNRSQNNPLLPLIAGGAIGLAMLIRTQSAIALPALLLITLLHRPQNWRAWLGSALLAGLGVGLAITPWLVRNAHLTSGLVFDHPASQTLVIAQRYNGLNFDDPIPMQADETLANYSGRLLRMAADGFFAHPGRSLHLAGGNWLNNFIDNLLILPLRPDLESPGELVSPTRAFWQTWRGTPNGPQTVVVGLYLFLFTSGAAAAWRLRRWVGLAPLAVNLSYNLWTGLFLSSGDRFLVPADWGFYLYPILGLLTLGYGLLRLIPRLDQQFALQWADTPVVLARPVSKKRLALTLPLAAVIIFLCGASVPWSETAVPARYHSSDNPQNRQKLLQAAAGLPESQAAEVVRLATLPEIQIEHGRAVYPRYYAAGEGEPETAKTGYAPGPDARLVFPFLGANNHLVIFAQDQPPHFFPHTADVFLFYRPNKNRPEVFAILAVKDNRAAFYQTGSTSAAKSVFSTR